MRHVEQDQASLPAPELEEPLKSQEELQIAEEVLPDVKIAQAYDEIRAERANQQNNKVISARDLAKRASIRRSTCSEWLQKHDELISNAVQN